jgi:hypothetical protein
MDAGLYDLLVRDPEIGRDVAFEFKAKVKGQNRRTDVDPAVTAGALLKLVEAMPRIVPQVAETGEPRADVVRHAGDGQPRWSAPADDAGFGRVVRLLAAADEEMLHRVESLLRGEREPGQSGS